MKCHIYQVEGAKNVRDIGGYPGRGNRPVQMGRFFRAGAIDKLTPGGCRILRELGVRCVVDLRSRKESERNPDTLRDDGEIAYVHIPMLDYINSNLGQEEPLFPASMTELYLGLLDHATEALRAVMDAMAEQEGPMLYHCTAGKDRTGVVTMLLLGLAGVSQADIVEDYSYSEHLLESEREIAANPILRDLPAYLFQSKPEWMETVLEYLRQAYGGVEEYLLHIGVTSRQQDRLRQKLLGIG